MPKKAPKMSRVTVAGLIVGAALPTMPHAQEPPAEGEVAEVIITGSRIAREDYTADSPIVTLGEEALNAVGPGTLEAVINTLPQFAALRPGSTLSPARGGRNNANLRGLGIGRTLVLLDGRRMQPSDLQGAVDLNTIPEALIQSVEVITGGASATYGSDAIAGVVNFKLNTRFEGFQVDAQYGVSYKGDADTYDLSALAGGAFAEGRGHAVMGVSYLDRSFVARGARKFFINKSPSTLLIGGAIQSDATNLPSQAVINSVFAQYGITGINVPRNSNIGVNVDGTLFTTNASGNVPILNLRYGDPPYYIADGTRVAQHHGEFFPLQQAMTKYNVFGNVSYEFSDWITAYGQFMYVRYDSAHQNKTTGVREPTIPITNPFIPAHLRTILASRTRPNDPLIYWYGLAKADDQRTTDTYTVDQGLVGLKGEVPWNDSWTWDVYASYGKTDDRTTRATNLDRAAVTTLLNATDGGRSVCPGGWDPFKAQSLASDPNTKACFDYVNRVTNGYATFSQKIAEASLQGDLIDLWAGTVKFAAGAGYRENSFSDRPDPQLVNATLVSSSPGEAVNRDGSDEVTEVFGELLIPLLTDVPLVKDFTINLAARSSNYKSIGVVSTYKGSFDWQIFEPIRLRASYQRAVRAPNLDELFPTPGFGGVLLGQAAQGGGDPCDINSIYRRGAAAAQVRSLCLAAGVPASVIDIFQFSGSSVETFRPPAGALTEETADTFTAGIVLRSPFEHTLISNIQLSVDYYDIQLDDAIGTITGPVTISLCFNANGASNANYEATNLFCQQILRDQGGRIVRIQTPRLNLASYKTSGVDTQLDWRLPLSAFGLDDAWGSLSLNLLVSYMKQYEIQNFAGDRPIEYTGSIGNAQIDAFSISHPEWKLQASATWLIDPLSFTLRARWIDAMYDSLDASATTRTRPGVPEKFYLDANASWQIRDDITLRLGVLNLTNTQPPFFNVSESTDVALYDIIGRRYSFGISKKF